MFSRNVLGLLLSRTLPADCAVAVFHAAAVLYKKVQHLTRTLAPPFVKIRSVLSSFLNRQLHRVGYALVRIDGERSPTMFTKHLGIRYAYEDIVVTDVLAPWAIDDGFLAIWNHVHDSTLVDIYRCYELYELVREAAHIPGDIL